MNSKELALIVLRISLSFVFLYFSITQLSDPGAWSSFVPDFFEKFGLTNQGTVVFNGFFELVLSLFLFVGLYTRFSALLLSIHLFGIAFFIGFNPLGVRDFGLAFATLALYLLGPDRHTLDYRFSKKLSR